MAELRLVIGRQRQSSVVSPSEAGYIESIKAQSAVIVANMQRVIAHVNNVSVEALEFGLKPIYDESQKLVPVDTGALKRSGYVEVRRMARGPVAEIGYGRYGIPTYTAFVHEVPMNHAGATTHKFLEKAINSRIDDFRRRVILYIQRETGVSK